MKTGRLIRIGLLFAFSIIILFWGINFLKGKKFLKPEKIFYAEYAKIGGLNESSPVTVNGFNVGMVREISLNDFSKGKILVKFIINYPDLELPVGSSAKIISTDLMGTKAIEILLAESEEYYSYNDTLPGLIEGDLKDQVNNQMLPLKHSAENLMASMDSVLVALQLVFGPQNRNNLAQSFESVNETIRNLEKTTVFLDQYVKEEAGKFSLILSNADSLSAGLKNRSTELHQIITNVTNISDTLGRLPLNEVAAKLDIVLTDLHSLFNDMIEGKGNLGKLSQDDSLYLALTETASNLNQLITDIRINPKRYIHVSAVDRGKTILVKNDSELLEALSTGSEMIYYTVILKSKDVLENDHALVKKFRDLNYLKVGDLYYYYIKESKKLDAGRRSLSKYANDYPGAGLYTWLNGIWHRIDLD